MSVPESTPDVLGLVLREVSFTSAAYRWIEMGAPFRLVFDRPGLRGVHLIAAGACELVLADGSVTPLTAGDTVILPRGDDHELRSGRAAIATSGFELAARTAGVRLRGGGPTSSASSTDSGTTIVCGAFIAGDPDHPALRGMPRVIHVPGKDGSPPAWLAPYVEVLRQEAFDAGPGSDVVMARLSDALIARALRESGGLTDHPGWLAGLRDPHLGPVLGSIHAEPARPWTLATLAAAAGLSRTAFAARFAAVVGEPPMHYLRSLRLHHAKRLLRDERLTVAAVAARVGYGSDVAFAATFRRVVGVPPAEWRRRPPETPEPGPA
ncbi:AraC family transcriptional regulator [Actinoplanes bogorensis]|uniref:AraC family transcriptional regulator n=1 Tax=Paractinoplanes bogorensis TaxID=1610840 RepID=A0ABS5YRI3_9ACTN|nr:AraC family transcriptional regulator [Actinoplanes bogorensis]MBU2665956.1 AraC family transcriptional regulator [Actinoplanes bogorensis]